MQGNEEADIIALMARKRSSKAKHEVLQANRARAEAVMEAECLCRILKEVEERIDLECTRGSTTQEESARVSIQAQVTL